MHACRQFAEPYPPCETEHGYRSQLNGYRRRHPRAYARQRDIGTEYQPANDRNGGTRASQQSEADPRNGRRTRVQVTADAGSGKRAA